MVELIVVGPIHGVFHIGFWEDENNTFFSINKFVSKELAEAAAGRLVDFRKTLPEV